MNGARDLVAIVIVALLGLLSWYMLRSMVSRQKGPTRHAYAWWIGPFWQDTLEVIIGKSSQLL